MEVFGEVVPQVFSINASEEEVIESGGAVRFGSSKRYRYEVLGAGVWSFRNGD